MGHSQALPHRGARGGTMKRERIARILAEAEIAPTSTEVAKRYRISYRSLMRYQERCRSDDALAALVAKEREALRAGWVQDANAFLRTAFRKMATLTEVATKPGEIRPIAGAVKITAEALTVREALQHGQQPGDDREGAATATAAGVLEADEALPVH